VDLEDKDDPEAEEITSTPRSGPIELNIPLHITYLMGFH